MEWQNTPPGGSKQFCFFGGFFYKKVQDRQHILDFIEMLRKCEFTCVFGFPACGQSLGLG